MLCLATAANAIVGVAWITDWPWMLLLLLFAAAAAAAAAAAVAAVPTDAAATLAVFRPGVGACGCTAGLWPLAATILLLLLLLLLLLFCVPLDANTDAAVGSCCWFLLGVELIILLTGAANESKNLFIDYKYKSLTEYSLSLPAGAFDVARTGIGLISCWGCCCNWINN